MFLDQKKGFLGYDALYQTKPKIVVVPFGLEKTVSYGKGTKNGPQEIIKASHQVELFDEDNALLHACKARFGFPLEWYTNARLL